MSNCGEVQVPGGWKKNKIGNLLTEVKSLVEMHDDEEYSLLSIRRRNRGVFFREKLKGEKILTKTLCKAINKTFVISKMQVVHGACGVIKKKFSNGYLSASYISFLPSKGAELDIDYFNYFSSMPPMYSLFLRSSHGVHIEKMTFNVKDWLNQKVILPSLPEQKKIASILTSMDDIIEKTEAQISKLQDLKKGMMTELLTKGIGHTEFKDSPVGLIPARWEVKQFVDVSLKIQDGTHFSPKSKEGGYKYVTSKNIRFGFLDTENIQFISKEEHEEIYKRCDVRYGDVLITKDGANTGNSALNTFNEPISLLSSVAFIRCEESKCLNSYMFQFLLSDWCQREIQDLMTGNAITRLTLEKIKNMKLPIPPIREQIKITQLIDSIDSKMIFKKRKLSQTKALKKALMNDLLTGKKRVNVN